VITEEHKTKKYSCEYFKFKIAIIINKEVENAGDFARLSQTETMEVYYG
jgi:hypothetical protein